MEFFILHYKYVENYLEARRPYREAHMELARTAARDGLLRYGGAIEGPPWEALIVFDTDDRARVDAFVGQDPFVQHSVVSEYRIARWPIAVGAELDR